MIATESPYAMNFESAFFNVSTIEMLLLSTYTNTDFAPATDIRLPYVIFVATTHS